MQSLQQCSHAIHAIRQILFYHSELYRTAAKDCAYLLMLMEDQLLEVSSAGPVSKALTLLLLPLLLSNGLKMRVQSSCWPTLQQRLHMITGFYIDDTSWSVLRTKLLPQC